MRRVLELDALRGIAALMVVSLHMGLGTDYAVLGSAVDMFFVLSGYLITRIILSHETRPRFLTPFYARRVLRIWPIYYAVLIGFVVVNPLLTYRQRTTGLPYYLTFTQFLPRYWSARPPAFSIYFAHTWTLAAEEQFYLLWPLVAVLLGRRALLATIPLLVGSAFMARLWLWPMLLVTNWDGFALGALLAWMMGEPGSPRARRPIVIGALMTLGAAMLAYPMLAAGTVEQFGAAWTSDLPKLAFSLNASRLSLLYFSIVGLVIAFAGHPLLRPLRDPSLCYLGTISYGIYLYHLPLFALMSPLHFTNLCNDSMGLDALKLATTFALAVLSWQFIEKPILRLKDRFPYPLSRAGEPESDNPPELIPPHPHWLLPPWSDRFRARAVAPSKHRP
ncbi:acyltransferase family protein [Singulisphaera sp. GP187]|uniref:acyltransferase family protein n=1 Tax=Singulisphaera sp. GP187 TaxID=1882752 RepID=UPI000940A79C|nr:acyltransferase [Singulisphaera sp. GP187]